jgi:hypothetical protein
MPPSRIETTLRVIPLGMMCLPAAFDKAVKAWEKKAHDVDVNTAAVEFLLGSKWDAPDSRLRG